MLTFTFSVCAVVTLDAPGITVTVGVVAGALPLPLPLPPFDPAVLDPPHPSAAQAAIQKTPRATHPAPTTRVIAAKVRCVVPWCK
jgi:hypothetical protein